MNLDASFFKEEIRSGFLVTEKRKKVWATELEILERFDEVCKKHHLTYYAYYGTLLGAVRHQGFIPWDDDIDVIMFRDDYEKFQAIAPEEFTEPYFFQNTYTDRVLWPFSKIRDSRTTAAEPQFNSLGCTFHQGIFIDIFPFDSVDDGISPQFSTIAQIQDLLWVTVTDPEAVISALEKGQQLYLSADFLIDCLQKSQKERFKIYEAFNLSCLGKSRKVNYLISEMCPDHFDIADFQNTIYLPFEDIQLPVPSGYEHILTQCYGDYHKFVPGGSTHNGVILEPDIPYTEYFSRQ